MTPLARFSACALLAVTPVVARAQAPAPSSPPTGPRAAFPSFSADGKRILYLRLADSPSEPGQPRVITVDGTDDREIPIMPGTSPQWLSLSPNARYIAYLSVTRSHQDMSTQLAVIGVDGTGARILAGTGGWLPKWSPDGGSVLFTTVVQPFGPGAWGVAVVNADGSGLTQLSTGLSGIEVSAWSPDGGRLLIVAPTTSGTAVMLSNRDGSDRRQLVSTPAYQTSPAWSRDGRWIAFLGADSAPTNPLHHPGQRLYVVNADGTSPRAVVQDASGISGLSFSPDGKALLFAARRGGRASDIFAVNADGTNERNLVNWPGTDEVPSWSPDGRLIVFQSSTDPQGRTPHVYIMNADGSDVRLLR